MGDLSSVSGADDREFRPLPMYVWLERPWTVPIGEDEAATAIYLARGAIPRAASFLKVDIVRLQRLIRRSPALQHVLDEALDVVAAKAESIPIETLFDENADNRRLEWASTQVRQMRYFQGRAMSPATQGSGNISITQNNQEIVYTWGEHVDESKTIEHDDAG